MPEKQRTPGEILATARSAILGEIAVGDREDGLPGAPEEPDELPVQGLGGFLERFDDRILHPDLIALCRGDFSGDQFADASRRAAQYLNQEVLAKCRDELVRRNAAKAQKTGNKPAVLKDGTGLMQQVFAIDNPVLQIPAEMTTQSDQSEQLGYGSLMQGVIGAFRNPRSHDVFYEDDPLNALLIIELVQHLLEVLDTAQLVSEP